MAGINISFLIKSSSNPEISYKVVFNNKDGLINIKCDCPAGELTKLCKHKLNLIRGDDSALLYLNNPDDWCTVKKWINNSAFCKLIIEHDRAEEAVKEGQKVFKIIKEKIELAMRKGI